MLVARGLACERGGRPLFRDLDFDLGQGGLLHVQGANGSGKTSLLRMLCGLSLPAAGSITWGDADICGLRENYAAQLIYVGHHPAVKDELSALENLQVSQALAGQPASRAQALAALGTVGLQGRVNLPVRVLSQGQRRRVALARLWLGEARLWVLDEPFTALDVEAAALLERHIEGHLAGDGMVVLTTHQQLGIGAGRVHVLTLS